MLSRIGTRLAGRRHPAGPAGALRPMLLFTDGLVRRRSMSRAAGLTGLRVPAAEESPGWTTSASTCSQHVPVTPPRRRHLPLAVRLLADAIPLRQAPRSTVAAEHAQRRTPFTTEARAHP